MNTIIIQNDFTGKYLGKQSVYPDKKYHISKYCITLTYKNSLIVYNTMTKEMIALTKNEAEKFTFDKELFGKEIPEKLISDWFYISEGIDEHQLSKQMLSIAKMVYKPNEITTFTIFPTTDCNARCFYCFELGCKRENMTEKTAVDVADYIIKVSKGKEIKLLWFGGEPLFNSKAIDIICERLNNDGVKFVSQMTTNGYLFDESLIKKAVNLWNLRSVQITLDGTEKTYNKAKSFIYKDEPNPFARVYANLGKLIDSGIFVMVRYNMDTYNVDDLYVLSDIIKRDYGNKTELLKIAPEMLFENVGADKRHRTDEQRDYLHILFFGLCDYLNKNGLLFVPPMINRSLTIFHCMADNDKNVTIVPNGGLGLCEHHYDDNLFGSIYSEDKDLELINRWKEPKPAITACDDCFYFPMCSTLKKCPQTRAPECTANDRKRWLYYIQESLKVSYDLWLKGELKVSEEDIERTL